MDTAGPFLGDGEADGPQAELEVGSEAPGSRPVPTELAVPQCFFTAWLLSPEDRNAQKDKAFCESTGQRAGTVTSFSQGAAPPWSGAMKGCSVPWPLRAQPLTPACCVTEDGWVPLPPLSQVPTEPPEWVKESFIIYLKYPPSHFDNKARPEEINSRSSNSFEGPAPLISSASQER